VSGPCFNGGDEAAFGTREIFVAREGTQAEKVVKSWMRLDGIPKVFHSPSVGEFDFDVRVASTPQK
jgi:hypothetical protein